jgi:hypothetical protein
LQKRITERTKKLSQERAESLSKCLAFIGNEEREVCLAQRKAKYEAKAEARAARIAEAEEVRRAERDRQLLFRWIRTQLGEVFDLELWRVSRTYLWHDNLQLVTRRAPFLHWTAGP